jgi:hypothetical protein
MPQVCVTVKVAVESARFLSRVGRSHHSCQFIDGR